ncbi:MAG: hypothetical protein V8T90_09365 [Victivallales bacterium]
MRFAVLFLLFLLAGINVAAETLSLPGTGFRCDFPGGKPVVVDVKSGKRLFSFNGLTLGWGPGKTGNAEATRLSPDTVHVQYEVRDLVPAACTADYTVNGPLLTIRLEAKVPENRKPAGALFLRMCSGKPQNNPVFQSGIWTRHQHGGVPFETKGAVIRRFDFRNLSIFEEINGNPGWHSHSGQHVALQFDKKTGTWSQTLRFLILPRKTLDQYAATFFEQAPIGIRIPASVPFNLWKPGEEIFFDAEIANISEKSPIPYTVVVKDYDGKDVFRKTGTLTLPAGEAVRLRFKPSLPQERGIWFAEIRADGTAFARTTLTILPDHVYQAPENSVFGISAAFPVPSRQDVAGLLKRMGIRWVREMNNDNLSKESGAAGFYHSNRSRKQWISEPEKRNAYIREILSRCREKGFRYWEFPNEWNMSSLNTGKYADVLVKNWIEPIAKLRKETNSEVRIVGPALAGADPAFLKAFHANGGWDLIDEVSIHPGRGNFTADYAGHGYWTYYGSILSARKTLRELGEKPLHLTEIYACTQPNSWWKDSYRQAAENIVLSYALAVAEGVKSALFYQLHDGVWHNPGGIRPTDHEYHYGILHRDGTAKPSLPAFCAIAEAMDGASFLGWIPFKDPKRKGLLFERRGQEIAILWDRTDGYIQAKKSADFAHREPWVDHWKSFRTAEIPVAGTELTLCDAIGRRRTLPAPGNRAKLRLSGSPVILYGTNFKPTIK